MLVRVFALILLLIAGCGGPTFSENDNGRTVEVDRGETFRFDLLASSKKLPPDRQFTRMDPGVTGGSIRFLRRESLPDKGIDRFEFEAVGPGKATVSFARSFDKNLPPPRNGQMVYPKREIDCIITVRVRR